MLCTTCPLTPPTYAAITFRKPPHKSSKMITQMVSCVHIYNGVPLKSKLQHIWTWSAPRLALSPSSIFPPSSPHCAFITARQNPTRFQNLSSRFFFFFYFLKLRKSEIEQIWECLCLIWCHVQKFRPISIQQFKREYETKDQNPKRFEVWVMEGQNIL